MWDGDRTKPVFENWVLTLHAVETHKVLHRDRNFNQANVYGYETFTKVHLQILNYYSKILGGQDVVTDFNESNENNALLACMMISNPITMNYMQFNTFAQFKGAFDKGFKTDDSRKKQALLALGIPDTQRYVSNALLRNIPANFALATYTGSDMSVDALTDLVYFINQHNNTNATTGLRLPDNPLIATDEQVQKTVGNPTVIPETNADIPTNDFYWSPFLPSESPNTGVEKSAAVAPITSSSSDIDINGVLKEITGTYGIIALGENDKDISVSKIIITSRHLLAKKIHDLLSTDPIYQEYTPRQQILNINIKIAEIAKMLPVIKEKNDVYSVYSNQDKSLKIKLTKPTPAVLVQEEGGLSSLNELILGLFYNDAVKKNNEIADDIQQENDWASSMMNNFFIAAASAIVIRTGLAGTLFRMFTTRKPTNNVPENIEEVKEEEEEEKEEEKEEEDEEYRRIYSDFDSIGAQAGLAPVIVNPFLTMNTKAQEHTVPLYNFQTKYALFVETLKKRQMICWLKVRAAYEISQLSKAYQKKMFNIVRGIPNLLDPICKAIIFCNNDPNMRLVLSSVFNKSTKVNKIFKTALENKDKVPNVIDALWLQNFTDPEYVFAWGRNKVFVPMTGEDALELPEEGMKTPDGILLTNANFEHYRLLVFLIEEFTVMSIKGDINSKLIQSRTSRAVRQNKI